MGQLSREDQYYLAENFMAIFNRDYRRIAELHVEAGWMPATVRIDELEAAARAVCARAKAMATTMIVTPSDARAFFEASFSAAPAATADGRPGLLTSYFAPEYPARRRPDAEFSAPVLPKPADPRAAGDRTSIEYSARPDQALAWMRAEDLFFLQIQGSGYLTFEDGTRGRAAYAADNGKPFVGIARVMAQQGLLLDLIDTFRPFAHHAAALPEARHRFERVRDYLHDNYMRTVTLDELAQVAQNLIDNAIRYTPAGGRITVRVRHDATARRVHLEVEDTGLGIPLAERPRVVERFYRILGREGDGSGLGLAIVREITTMHGGEMTIDDNVYQTSPRLAGTLVRVSLHVLERAQDLP